MPERKPRLDCNNSQQIAGHGGKRIVCVASDQTNCADDQDSFRLTCNEKTGRANWSADQFAAIAPYEGTAVTAVGCLYNVRVESGGKGESTNCHFTEPADVDWHMYFDGDGSKGEAEAIIAETTPRIHQQHPNWMTAKLAPWMGTGVPVRLSGWLMLDPEHPDALGKAGARCGKYIR